MFSRLVDFQKELFVPVSFTECTLDSIPNLIQSLGRDGWMDGRTILPYDNIIDGFALLNQYMFITAL